jgi:hypothetical protein
MLYGTKGFSPPWCDMTDFYCPLEEILTISYPPDSYKVRSGPGVSAIKKFQITKHKYQTNPNDRNSKFQPIDF